MFPTEPLDVAGTLFVAVSFIVTFGVAFLYLMVVGGKYGQPHLDCDLHVETNPPPAVNQLA